MREEKLELRKKYFASMELVIVYLIGWLWVLIFLNYSLKHVTFYVYVLYSYMLEIFKVYVSLVCILKAWGSNKRK